MSLSSMIILLKRYNRKAQQEFYDMFCNMMFLVCKRILGIDADAEECVLDGFTIFFKKIDQFNYIDDASVVAYLKSLMITECRNRLKTKKRTILFDSLESAGNPVYNEKVFASIDAEDLLKVIDQLPEEYRIIFSMSEIEGYTHEEIGEALNIATELSRKKLERAKKYLQDLILKKYNNDERRKSG